MAGRILLFTLLRLAVFAIPFVVLMLIGFDWLWALILASVTGLALSYLVLSPLRDGISRGIWERRSAPEPPADVDAEVEDAAVERFPSSDDESASGR